MNVNCFSPCTVAVVGLLSVSRFIFFQVPVSLWIAECFLFILCTLLPVLLFYEVSSRAVLPQQDTTGTCYSSWRCCQCFTNHPVHFPWLISQQPCLGLFFLHENMFPWKCNVMCIIVCWCNQIKLIMHSITVLFFINSVKLPFNLLLQATQFYVKSIIAPYCTQRVNAFVCNALFLTMFNILNKIVSIVAVKDCSRQCLSIEWMLL